MKLQERLPNSLTINGKKYRLDFDFRNVLSMLEILARDDMMPDARAWLALKCLMKHPPKNPFPLLGAIKLMLFPEAKNEPSAKKLTDFKQDADLIRAAFLQVYGINLWRDSVHWVEFAALLNALPEGSRYSEILGIRARPMPKPTKYNAEERRWLAQAKAACAVQMSDKELANLLQASMHRTTASLLALAKRGEQGGK